MLIETIRGADAHLHSTIMDENHKRRHQIFVDRLGWEALRKPDGRDVDEYDTGDATHLLLTDCGRLRGGARLTPLTCPNLLTGKFSNLVVETLPDSIERGIDWTRHYVIASNRRAGHLSTEAALLYSACMEFALKSNATFFTFVSSIYMIELLTSFNWKVVPLGPPRIMDGSPTIAGAIEVSEEALFHINALNGILGSALAAGGPSILRNDASASVQMLQ